VIDLNLNENLLTRISPDLAHCPKLKILRLQNNLLSLNDIPEKILSDSKVRFIIKMTITMYLYPIFFSLSQIGARTCKEGSRSGVGNSFGSAGHFGDKLSKEYLAYPELQATNEYLLE
jgi:hypothetical protein